MKKKQVDAILVDQVKRNKKIMAYVCAIFLICILGFCFLFVHLRKNQSYEVAYNETSKVDYKVYLKDNQFFEKDYLEKDNQYIASLIDNVVANFNYQISLDAENVTYDYTYRIDAEVKVVDKTTKKVLFNKIEDLVDSKRGINTHNLSINESVDIDYSYYNNLIQSFVNIYKLDDAISTLLVNMHVSVIGACDKFEEASNNETVISVEIPLTTKTVAIDINSNMIDNDDNIILCNDSSYSVIFIVLSCITFGCAGYLLAKLIKYIIITRTAEKVYEKELKKILNNYRSYIQKVNNTFDLKGYQSLTVDTFTDMLEIRDTIQQPILMVEEKNKKGTFFIIPSNTKILYIYGLKVSDIKKEMLKNASEVNN